ncbi:hypothetical protein ACS0TY_036621 [Phlomoides rotata]
MFNFEGSGNGGSISKVTSKYFTVRDFSLKEEEIKAGKERVLAMYKAVEAFLIQNPVVAVCLNILFLFLFG